MQWAWLRRLVRRTTTYGYSAVTAAWCAWTMVPSGSRAARSRTAIRRGCVRPAHVASARAGCCIGARCVLHRRALHRSNTSPCMLHQHVASMRVASVRIPRCIGAHCTLHVSSVRAAPVRVARCIGACRMLYNASARGSRCIGACWRFASARVARCMLQTHGRPAAHGRAVRCVVSGARALPDRAKVLHVGTRYALYSARCGASAACFLLRVRRVVCDTPYADGVGRL